jgi:hypothetical protein
MKGCLSGGKQMSSVMRVQGNAPSEARIRKLLKKKREKKKNKI